ARPSTAGARPDATATRENGARGRLQSWRRTTRCRVFASIPKYPRAPPIPYRAGRTGPEKSPPAAPEQNSDEGRPTPPPPPGRSVSSDGDGGRRCRSGGCGQGQQRPVLRGRRRRALGRAHRPNAGRVDDPLAVAAPTDHAGQVAQRRLVGRGKT